MTAILESDQFSRSSIEIARAFRERISDWSDFSHIAQEAADLLRAELSRPTVSVIVREPSSGDLLLVASAPQSNRVAPKGSRSTTDRAMLERVIREQTAHRSLNHYVAPDFVLSQPGETRSAMAVPVVVDSAVQGVLHLEYVEPDTPSSADEELTEVMAGQLAAAWGTAVRDGTAVDETQVNRRLREVAALGAISSALAQTEDASEVLDRVVATTADLLAVSGVLVLTRHPSRQQLEVAAGTGCLQITPGTLIPIDGTGAGQVARTGRAVEITRDALAQPAPLPAELLSWPALDAIMVPVASAGTTAGVLIAIAADSESSFSADDARLLQTLADLAGAAISVRSVPKLRQRISDASLIAEVGRAMTGTLGLDEVLAMIVRAAEMLVSGGYASVALLDDDRSHFVLAATSGSLRGSEGATVAARESVLGWVATGGECVVTDALASDPRGWPLDGGHGPAALVPLESHSQIRGVLLAGRPEGAPLLSDADLDTLRKLASYAAIGIENARLYRTQTELSRQLQAQADELEKAYAELRASQERLLVSEKMAALGRVTAGIAHEINSPLGSILNCLQLANTYADEYRQSAHDPEVTPDDHGEIANDLLETLKLAEEATRRVAQFVRTIKGQTRMEEERVLRFDPASEVEGTILLLKHELGEERISIQTDLQPGLEVSGDPTKFAVVVQNLLSNAVDAYDDTAGTVRIRLASATGSLVLEVTDAGSGIPEEIRPRIYDYLFTTKDIGRGTGLGLSLVHSIVTSHFRGSVEFRTETGAGTTFIVTIPVGSEN